MRHVIVHYSLLLFTITISIWLYRLYNSNYICHNSDNNNIGYNIDYDYILGYFYHLLLIVIMFDFFNFNSATKNNWKHKIWKIYSTSDDV